MCPVSLFLKFGKTQTQSTVNYLWLVSVPSGVCVGSAVGSGVATVVVAVVVSGRGVVIPGGNPFNHLLRDALISG